MLSILRERFRLHARLSRIGRPKFKMKCRVGRRITPTANLVQQLILYSSFHFQFVPVPHFKKKPPPPLKKKKILNSIRLYFDSFPLISNLRLDIHFTTFVHRRLSTTTTASCRQRRKKTKTKNQSSDVIQDLSRGKKKPIALGRAVSEAGLT